MIRVIAMILIVSCHVAQCYDLQVAFILNVGVQIFFFMSGFLYGKQEDLPSPADFYKKRFVKLYLPYFVLLVVVVGIYAIFHLAPVSFKQIVFYVLNLQWFATPIEGLNHLWFLTVLMVAYVLTPWIKTLLKKNPVVFWLVFGCCCLAEFVFIKKFYSFFAWLALYVSGILYGNYHSKIVANIVLVASSIALVSLGLFFEPSKLTNFDDRYYSIWLHCILGLFIFVFLFRFLPLLISERKKHGLLKHFDKISYEVYLIHHPLILGPLSLMFVTKVAWLNIVLMLLVVYLLSRVLYYICHLFTKALI